MKLYLKGERCYTDKCAIERRNYAPGQHGQGRRRKISEYAIQLREKQRLKRMYGLLERQFHRYFEMAERSRIVTGEALLQLLERRLDNIVYRLNFASSRKQARQIVQHGHVLVNGRAVDVPSYQVRAGDEIRMHGDSKDMLPVQASLESKIKPTTVRWLAVDEASRTGRVLERPGRADIPLAVQEQLIVELYSK